MTARRQWETLLIGMPQHLPLIRKDGLQLLDWDLPRLHLMLNGEMRGGAGGLPERHPRRFHPDRRIRHVRGRRCHGHDQAVDSLRDHDAIGDLVGPGDVVEHAEIPFEDGRVCWLPLAAGKAVDGKLADRDRVGMAARTSVRSIPGDVVLGQRVLADQTTALADVELEGEVPVVLEFIRRQVQLVGELAMFPRALPDRSEGTRAGRARGSGALR